MATSTATESNANSLSTVVDTLFNQLSTAEVSSATTQVAVGANQQSEYFKYTLFGVQENFWNGAANLFGDLSIQLGQAQSNSGWGVVRSVAGLGSLAAAALGSVSQKVAGLVSLADIPRLIDNVSQSYEDYASRGIGTYDATMLMFNPATGLFEWWDGVSYGSHDFNHELDGLDRFGRGIQGLLGTAGAALGGVAGLRSLGARLGTGGTSTLNGTYRMYSPMFSADRARILTEISDLKASFRAFPGRRGNFILELDKAPTDPITKRPIFGRYNSVNNTITFYKDFDLSTMAHELLHFRQAVTTKRVGARLASNLYEKRILENQVDQWMVDWMFTYRF